MSELRAAPLILDDVQRASLAIRPDVPRTPLLRCFALEQALGLRFRLFMKCENLHRSRSFKERGATYALKRLPAEAKARGVVTRSSGNFAQALALAGAREKVAITVVMPTTAPQVKVDGTRLHGATVIQQGTTHAEGLAAVQELVQSRGLSFLPPFDHPDVMVGQGTAALEVVEELPNLRHFYAPIGGGGLMGGCAIALKGINPHIEVVGVEPEGAADFVASMTTGSLQTLDSVTSIADGLLAPKVGEVNWPVLRTLVDRAQLITEEQIVLGMCHIVRALGMIVEPSGAVALAGLLASLLEAHKTPAGDTVCLVSGGNVDLKRFYALCGDRLF